MELWSLLPVSHSACSTLVGGPFLILQSPRLWNYLPAPSKGFQLNPKGPRDGELTPFRNHLAPFGRSMYMNGWFLFKGFSCRKNIPCSPMDPLQIGGVLKNSEKKKNNCECWGFQTSSGGEPSNSQIAFFFFSEKNGGYHKRPQNNNVFCLKNVHDACMFLLTTWARKSLVFILRIPHQTILWSFMVV